MLFRAIKHQVDKGPVDAVTGKAKYTLNDNRLLREDVEYRTLVRHTLYIMIMMQKSIYALFRLLQKMLILLCSYVFAQWHSF